MKEGLIEEVMELGIDWRWVSKVVLVVGGCGLFGVTVDGDRLRLRYGKRRVKIREGRLYLS